MRVKSTASRHLCTRAVSPCSVMICRGISRMQMRRGRWERRIRVTGRVRYVQYPSLLFPQIFFFFFFPRHFLPINNQTLTNPLSPPQKGPRRIPRLNLKLPLLRNHLVTFSPHFRPHRPHLHPHDTCVHQRRPNPFYPRFRDKPARLRLCRQRCARARAGGGESAVDQHYFAHGGGGSHVYFE